MRRRAVTERDIERALTFRQCPQCDYDFATRTGVRGCDLYACPYLPEALDTSCPNCNYNFATGEGRSECGEPPSCEFAREEAPGRIDAMRRWLGSE